MRSWMRVVAAVLLIMPFATALLHAADPELPLKKEDFQRLVDKVDKLQSEMTANSLRGTRTAEDLREIRVELQKIRELLERMAAQQGAIQRQSLYGPSLSPIAPVPTTGTITVENSSSFTATVRIDGRSYVVRPGQTIPIRGVPTGTFQYSVDAEPFGTIQPLQTDTLRPGGYTIRIYPRMSF